VLARTFAWIVMPVSSPVWWDRLRKSIGALSPAWVRFPAVARAALALIAIAVLQHAHAHDIPDEVRVQAFVKPQGERLALLVRVPLKAMRDVDVPRRERGMLDFSRVDTTLRDAATLWLSDEVALYENGTRLGRPRVAASRVSLESDRSFGTYESALAHLASPPLANDTELYWSQGLLDVLLEYPIGSERSAFSIEPNLQRLGIRVSTVLRFLPPGGEPRAFELHGDAGLVHLDPSGWQAAATFVRLGFAHILEGTDHLLFVLCLVVPFRRFWPLAAIVTAFTLAHSVTLIGAALGYRPDAGWFAPMIEWLIAGSILWMAAENALARDLQPGAMSSGAAAREPGAGGKALRRRWAIAFAFGLVHGFGFSFGLQQQLQFAGSHLVASLLAFNLGVEAGQLLVVALLVPALALLMRGEARARAVTILVSLLVGHTAWHWTLERWDLLRKFPLPTWDLATLASGVRGLMVLVAVAGVAWALAGLVRGAKTRRRRGAPADD
jgi:hypothetical protein